MMMRPAVRKLALVAHSATSVGVLGAVAVFLSLALIGFASSDPEWVRAAYVANGIATWHVILPLTVGALLTGVIQALGTLWGLFRHYWVLAKLLLTMVTLAVLIVQLNGIDEAARLASQGLMEGGAFRHLRLSFVIHAGSGMVVLLTIVALSIYKPRGLTAYGRRRAAQ